ncbi:hypothetical protein ANN_23735 [Periplaneta americana]|uniref:LysR substrate-binding domain-containing protein n=1 Tax=Periplaneta americana TaxID=6978 RepID=A0ABQ8SLX9_PERAM|nr:hypothetical protein ANN_23735 [Periplaneta americana]
MLVVAGYDRTLLWRRHKALAGSDRAAGLVAHTETGRQVELCSTPAHPVSRIIEDEAVITRWGTWTEVENFFKEHFKAVNSVVEIFSPESASSVRESMKFEAAMIAIEPSSSFVPISLQRDVIIVHRPGEIRNTLRITLLHTWIALCMLAAA